MTSKLLEECAWPDFKDVLHLEVCGVRQNGNEVEVSPHAEFYSVYARMEPDKHGFKRAVCIADSDYYLVAIGYAIGLGAQYGLDVHDHTYGQVSILKA